MKSKVTVILKGAISIGLLAFLLTQVNLQQTWTQLQHLSWSFVLFALLYYTVCQWMSCIRWSLILRTTHHTVPIAELMKSYFAGMFLNIFLPGATSGDVYRVYKLAQTTKDPEIALVSVFLERFTGLVALSALGVLGLVPAFRLIGRWDIIFLFLGCVAALVGGVVLITSPKLLRWVEPWFAKYRLARLTARMAKIQLLLQDFVQYRQILAASLALSLLLQLAIVYYHYMIAQQLAIPVSYLQLLVFIPIIVVITLLPISFGGLGLKEGLWIYLFGRVELTAEQAFLLSVTITALSWLLSLPGAIVLLLDSTGLQQMSKKN
ncbi:lysylphosphatidylglycerol synthase transmembrane domain-containing protein [Leptolyngbya sp. NIES-2104]|uniref:lysylphosphatidylglycerol synthase transmembrane domain-containing protein n=1 Tax=Leptolyngbya sp. NIES-2104 TaxID=1552121 RepID=UPI0006EC6148|nr:lysylphosphatidylglycerol synthase transmembrane domain-containing protein [Leptolyngbya sp. NIES-2104]GAP93819.1 hypothetical protein NIES2104_03280 [Leptolyngbya sp. NIES-2104]